MSRNSCDINRARPDCRYSTGITPKDLALTNLTTTHFTACYGNIREELHVKNIVGSFLDIEKICVDEIIIDQADINRLVVNRINISGDICGVGTNVLKNFDKVMTNRLCVDTIDITGDICGVGTNTLKDFEKIIVDTLCVDTINITGNICGVGTNILKDFDIIDANILNITTINIDGNICGDGTNILKDFAGIQLTEQGSPPFTNTTDEGGFYVSSSTSGKYVQNTPIFVDGDNTEFIIGNVTGPVTSTDNALARYDGITGCIIQNSGVTLSDMNVFAVASGNMTFSVPVPNSVIIDGNLSVTGTTFSSNTEVVNVEDNCIYMNNGYDMTGVFLSGCIVINYLPVAVTDTVAGAFTAGVAAVSNPTVITTGAGTFSAGDIIQIKSADKEPNNGLFEVESHVGTTLTIRGIGTIPRTQDFFQENFVTDAVVAGDIQQVTVATIGLDSSGDWQTQRGDNSSDSTITMPVPIIKTVTGGTGITVDDSDPKNSIVNLDTPVSVADGGTGLMSYTIGDILYSDGVMSLTTLNIGTAGQVLTVNPGATAPEWTSNAATDVMLSADGAGDAQLVDGSPQSGPNLTVKDLSEGTNISLTNGADFVTIGVTGTIGVSNGGTGLMSYTIGDILYANGAASLTTLPIGSPGEVLAVNGGATAPEWVAGASGTVTSVGAGTGLNVSPGANPITTTGTINIADTGVVAGTYTPPTSVTVNAQGQLTAISSSPSSIVAFNASITNFTSGGSATRFASFGAGRASSTQVSRIRIPGSSIIVGFSVAYEDGGGGGTPLSVPGGSSVTFTIGSMGLSPTPTTPASYTPYGGTALSFTPLSGSFPTLYMGGLSISTGLVGDTLAVRSVEDDSGGGVTPTDSEVTVCIFLRVPFV